MPNLIFYLVIEIIISKRADPPPRLTNVETSKTPTKTWPPQSQCQLQRCNLVPCYFKKLKMIMAVIITAIAPAAGQGMRLTRISSTVFLFVIIQRPITKVPTKPKDPRPTQSVHQSADGFVRECKVFSNICSSLFVLIFANPQHEVNYHGGQKCKCYQPHD